MDTLPRLPTRGCQCQAKGGFREVNTCPTRTLAETHQTRCTEQRLSALHKRTPVLPQPPLLPPHMLGLSAGHQRAWLSHKSCYWAPKCCCSQAISHPHGPHPPKELGKGLPCRTQIGCKLVLLLPADCVLKQRELSSSTRASSSVLSSV